MELDGAFQPKPESSIIGRQNGYTVRLGVLTASSRLNVVIRWPITSALSHEDNMSALDRKP
jgi:hypothetical protein